jgi:hypothetical protein
MLAPLLFFLGNIVHLPQFHRTLPLFRCHGYQGFQDNSYYQHYICFALVLYVNKECFGSLYLQWFFLIAFTE